MSERPITIASHGLLYRLRERVVAIVQTGREEFGPPTETWTATDDVALAMMSMAVAHFSTKYDLEIGDSIFEPFKARQ